MTYECPDGMVDTKQVNLCSQKNDTDSTLDL